MRPRHPIAQRRPVHGRRPGLVRHKNHGSNDHHRSPVNRLAGVKYCLTSTEKMPRHLKLHRDQRYSYTQTEGVSMNHRNHADQITIVHSTTGPHDHQIRTVFRPRPIRHPGPCATILTGIRQFVTTMLGIPDSTGATGPALSGHPIGSRPRRTTQTTRRFHRESYPQNHGVSTGP
jgi:hypothetical protein